MNYISILDNEIISGGECPMVEVNGHEVQNLEVEATISENWWLYDLVDGQPVYSEQKEIAQKQNKVRAVRNSYLEIYVDPMQLPLRWNDLSDEEKAEVSGYRRYLLDYTTREEWWESNPMTFEEWKASK